MTERHLADHRQGAAHKKGRRQQDDKGGYEFKNVIEQRAVNQSGMKLDKQQFQGALQQQEQKGAQADAQLKPGEKTERILVPVGHTAQPPAAQGQPEKIGAQHRADGQCGIAENETENSCPNHFVQQPGEPGEKEEYEDKKVHKPAVRLCC